MSLFGLAALIGFLHLGNLGVNQMKTTEETRIPSLMRIGVQYPIRSKAIPPKGGKRSINTRIEACIWKAPWHLRNGHYSRVPTRREGSREYLSPWKGRQATGA